MEGTGVDVEADKPPGPVVVLGDRFTFDFLSGAE